MTDKHTPGPWEYSAHLTASENHRGFSVSAPTHRPSLHRILIADVIPMDRDGAEGEANARLIAAAPLLLDALKDMVDWMPLPRERDHPGRVVIDKARDAIRKARGEEAGS